MEHWNFLLGGLSLGAVALLYTATVGRPLGVSGAIAGVLRPEDPEDDAPAEAAGPLGRPLRFSEQGAFLAAVVFGGALSALLAGTWGQPLEAGLGDSFQQLFGSALEHAVGNGGVAVWLLVGGLLSGVGIQVARGCTSGHGLVGVARLQPASIIATLAFFGTAIAVSVAVDAIVNFGVKS